MKKKLFVILILVVCLFSLTGCYDAIGIENLAYVIAIGLDKGETDILKISLQITTLGSSESSSRHVQLTVALVLNIAMLL